MKKLSVILCFAFFIPACTTISEIHGVDVAGEYSMPGFNSETNLELRADRTYTISQWMISCLIEEDGSIESWGDEEKGSWTIKNGIIELETIAEEPREYYRWFSKLTLEYRKGSRVLISRVKSSPMNGRECLIEIKSRQ